MLSVMAEYDTVTVYSAVRLLGLENYELTELFSLKILEILISHDENSVMLSLANVKFRKECPIVTLMGVIDDGLVEFQLAIHVVTGRLCSEFGLTLD